MKNFASGMAGVVQRAKELGIVEEGDTENTMGEKICAELGEPEGKAQGQGPGKEDD